MTARRRMYHYGALGHDLTRTARRSVGSHLLQRPSHFIMRLMSRGQNSWASVVCAGLTVAITPMAMITYGLPADSIIAPYSAGSLLVGAALVWRGRRRMRAERAAVSEIPGDAPQLSRCRALRGQISEYSPTLAIGWWLVMWSFVYALLLGDYLRAGALQSRADVAMGCQATANAVCAIAHQTAAPRGRDQEIIWIGNERTRI